MIAANYRACARSAATDDRRKLIAQLTAKGEIVVEKAFGVAMATFGKLFAAFSREELIALTTLLKRVREELDTYRTFGYVR